MEMVGIKKEIDDFVYRADILYPSTKQEYEEVLTRMVICGIITRQQMNEYLETL